MTLDNIWMRQKGTKGALDTKHKEWLYSFQRKR